MKRITGWLNTALAKAFSGNYAKTNKYIHIEAVIRRCSVKKVFLKEGWGLRYRPEAETSIFLWNIVELFSKRYYKTGEVPQRVFSYNNV